MISAAELVKVFKMILFPVLGSKIPFLNVTNPKPFGERLIEMK